MQTKSEMINRITELAEEVEQRKHEYEVLDACLELAQGKIAELKAYKDVNEDFKTAWEELKAENDKLKEENYQLQKDCQICENFIDFIPCKPIRDMDYDLQKVINQRDKYYKQTLDDEIQINELMQENERLKQTLQEIKAIAENAINGEYKTKSSDYSEGMEIIGHYVMQKITKAESEEE